MKAKPKKSLGLFLSIDTEIINENFSYGGEQGKKIVQTDELSDEYKQICELAASCVKYMSN